MPNPLPENYRPLIQGAQGFAHRGGGIQSRLTAATISAPQRTPAEIKCREGQPSDAVYELNSTWEQFLRHVPDEDAPSGQVARRSLDQICQRTGAWVQTPGYDTNTIHLWGTEEQVSLATSQLKAYETLIQTTGAKPKHRKWIKESALDGRRVHRIERQSKIDEYAEWIKRYGEELAFDFEAHLIWPKFLDLNSFLEQVGDGLIKLSNEKFAYIVPETDDVPRIRIAAGSEKDVVHVYNRIINLVKEQLAQNNDSRRANLVRMPSKTMYRDRVGMDQDPKSTLYIPTLHGEPLHEDEVKDWEVLERRIRIRDRKRISTLLTQTIKGLQFSNKHVRMRVTFGEMAFSKFRKPAPGQDSHDFDDFYEMTQHSMTQLRQLPLRSPDGDISCLVDKLGEMREFGQPEMFYALHLDFQGLDSYSTLRLEAEFRPGLDATDLERGDQRWLEFRHTEKDEKLEINVLDFERPNYSLHIGAVKLHDNRLIRGQMRGFEQNLGMKMPPNGIKSYPARRAVFPPGERQLRRVSEISVTRFLFKDTEGRFELRRKDIYDEAPGQASAVPIDTEWTAAYYYHEWDNLYGTFAYLKPGQDVGWERDLATFFPEGMAEDDARALPRGGFKSFMREIEEIQDLLGNAIDNLPRAETKENQGP